MAPFEKPEGKAVFGARTQLGESPVWTAEGRFIWTDINGKKIHVVEASGEEFSIDTPEMVGAVVPTTDQDTLIALLHSTAVLVDLKSRRLGRVLATVPEAHGVDEYRFNDGKAAPGGTIIAGRMHLGWRNNNPGKLYRLDLKAGGQGEFVELLPSVGLPNGMVWQPEERKMFFIDSGAATITEFATDSGGLPSPGPSGAIEGKVVVQLEAGKHVPDGMAIDSDGKLWVALHGDGAVVRYDSKTGEEEGRLDVPIKKLTAPSFAGADLSKMYVTTRIEDSAAPKDQEGAIFEYHFKAVRGAAPAYVATLP